MRREIAAAVKKDSAAWPTHLLRHAYSLAIPWRNPLIRQSVSSLANALRGRIPRRMLSGQGRSMQPVLMLDAEMARARGHWSSLVWTYSRVYSDSESGPPLGVRR